MKRLFVLWLFAWSTVSADSWSPDQQAVIDQVSRCNDGWVESIAKKTFALFTSACPETPDAIYWYTGSPAPVSYGGADGMWSRSATATRAVSWRDLKPAAVQIDGDVALIYYTVTWTPEPVAGPVRSAPSRRLTVFRRVKGQWLMAGGTITAVP
jgi:hypothetical protein